VFRKDSYDTAVMVMVMGCLDDPRGPRLSYNTCTVVIQITHWNLKQEFHKHNRHRLAETFY